MPTGAANTHDSSRDGEPEPSHTVAFSLGTEHDQPTGDDSLGFEPYVKAVARFLRSARTNAPLTLSVEGEWGSGKSSFMLQLEEALREKPKQMVVHFNPWRHDTEDSVWAAFAIRFMEEMKKEAPWYVQWFLGPLHLLCARMSWRGLWLLLEVGGFLALTLAASWLAYQLGLAFPEPAADGGDAAPFWEHLGRLVLKDHPWLAVLALWGVALYKLAPKFKELRNFVTSLDVSQYFDSPDYGARISFVERFHEDFGKIVRAYARGQKVFVLIDDVDRCAIPKAADLMQALNLMITKDPPLVFIIGMDREKVAAGIAVKHANLLPYLDSSSSDLDVTKEACVTRLSAIAYGYSFIEKFIQLPFVVPKPDRDRIETYLSGTTPRQQAPSPAKSGWIGRGRAWFSQRLTRPVPRMAVGTESPTGVVEETGTGEKGQESGSDAVPSVLDSPPTATKDAPQSYQGCRRLQVVEEATDSERARKIEQMVAPTLGFNPRRLKQFVNVFRLRAYIASETKLLYDIDDAPKADVEYPFVTPEQLGKFVAMGLRWPLLPKHIAADPTLLARLQKHALGAAFAEEVKELKRLDSPTQAPQQAGGEETKNPFEHWRQDEALLALLLQGCPIDGDEADALARAVYGFHHVNTEKLLQALPAVPFPQPAPEAETGPGEEGTPTETEVQSPPTVKTEPTPPEILERALHELEENMVWIEGGEFMMGSPKDEKGRFESEGPLHEVRLDGLYVSPTPITQAQYEAIMGKNPSHFKGAVRPVESVSWGDATAFCAELSKRTAYTGREYALPTEAQWEYACRAGRQAAYHFGDNPDRLGDYTWYGENSGGKTHPVARIKPNLWGLYDVYGNVWEWCSDHWHDNYEGAPKDGGAWTEAEDSLRVMRGGSWRSGPSHCRSAYRRSSSPGSRDNGLGFRVVAVPTAGEVAQASRLQPSIS